jgi:transcriptional regulator with XRE-family HTH domain
VETDLRKILAFNVRRLRKSRGYSQDAFACLSGLSRSYIGDVERANHNVGIGNLDAIARCLDVTVAELFLTEDAADRSVTPEQPEIVINAPQFEELLNQCVSLRFRPDLVVIYLQRFGVRFI